MLKYKSTNIFSEIKTFFSEKDDTNAINAIMGIAQHLKNIREITLDGEQ